MKIRQHGVDNSKAITGIDKSLRLALSRFYMALACMFFAKSRIFRVRTVVVPIATTRRPSAFARLMAVAASPGISYHSRSVWSSTFFYSYRLKSSQSHMQGEISAISNAAPANLLQCLRSEVRAGRRRCH